MLAWHLPGPRFAWVVFIPIFRTLRSCEFSAVTGNDAMRPVFTFPKFEIPLPFILFLAALLACISHVPLLAQPDDSNSGVAIIAGERHAWLLEAPEGWQLDVAGARSSGLGAAFRPQETSWSEAPAVMYANTVLKDDDSVSVSTVVAGDVIRAEKRIPRTAVTEAESLGTIQGVEATVRYFIRSDSSLCEAVAYIEGPTVVALVVLSARSGKDFRASLDNFARLVDSYEWITSDPDQLRKAGRSR